MIQIVTNFFKLSEKPLRAIKIRRCFKDLLAPKIVWNFLMTFILDGWKQNNIEIVLTIQISFSIALFLSIFNGKAPEQTYFRWLEDSLIEIVMSHQIPMATPFWETI